MIDVPFTQYLRPNGDKRKVVIDMPDEVGRMAQVIIERGYVFECEELSTGECSFTVTDPEEGDLDIEVVSNGPEVPIAVERLIRRFATVQRIEA